MADGVADDRATTRDLARRRRREVPAEDGEPRAAHAIIIGIDRYDDERIPSLNYACADAKALYDVLTDEAFGAFTKENVQLLTDRKATRDNIITEIGTNLPKRLGRNDTVCIFFAGHGAPEPSSREVLSDGTEKYLLPVEANLDRLRATAISMEEVQKWFEWVSAARQVIFFVDSCYSGQAGGRTIRMPGVRAGLSDSFLTKLGGEARFVFTACGPNEVALEDPSLRHGVFTHYLVEGLSGAADTDGDGYVSASELCDYVGGQVDRHAKRLLGRMTPLQSGHVQGKVVLSRSRKAGTGKPERKLNLVADALDPGTFETPHSAVHCVTVQREAFDERTVIPLAEHVRRALDYHGGNIARAVAKCRRTTRPGSVSSAGMSIVPSALSVADAFASESALSRAIEAMCRADAVVFDITDFEPGVMLLLGIRSVARRGVTICSMGGTYVLGSEFAIPFNLQLLNLAAHSEAQEDRGVDPRDLLGSKLSRGFEEMAELPHYLDLPAFESVRLLGVNSEAYRPVQYTRQVLVLCPFSEAYTRTNWKTYLSKELSGKLMQHLRMEDEEAVGPVIVRLLDLHTPRLVAQTLYEAIRRTDLCIIDWTNLRANVMYEAGVRLACNRLGAVHIVEGAEGETARLGEAGRLRHVRAMVELFQPIRYSCRPGHTESYERMITRFRSTIEAGGEGLDGLVYRTVGAKYDHIIQPIAVSVIDELIRSANLLLSDDQESTGITPVLFHDVNSEILIAAETAASERRLAAWLYMERRYPDATLRNDPEMYTRLRSLAAQSRRWLRAKQETELDDYIKDRMVQIRDARETHS
jgi:hypothetical protein